MQGNLKQTVGVLDTQDFLPGAVDLRGGNLHLEWEALLLARLKEAVVTPALTQRRPVLTLASLLPVRAQQLISMHASAMQQQAICTASLCFHVYTLQALHVRWPVSQPDLHVCVLHCLLWWREGWASV